MQCPTNEMPDNSLIPMQFEVSGEDSTTISSSRSAGGFAGKRFVFLGLTMLTAIAVLTIGIYSLAGSAPVCEAAVRRGHDGRRMSHLYPKGGPQPQHDLYETFPEFQERFREMESSLDEPGADKNEILWKYMMRLRRRKLDMYIEFVDTDGENVKEPIYQTKSNLFKKYPLRHRKMDMSESIDHITELYSVIISPSCRDAKYQKSRAEELVEKISGANQMDISKKRDFKIELQTKTSEEISHYLYRHSPNGDQLEKTETVVFKISQFGAR